jgi:hypothetical protein
MVLFASCSPGETQVPDPGSGTLTIFPSKLFVGVDDAGHGFLAPLSATGATGLKWSTQSMDFTVSGDDHGAMVTGMIAGGGDINVTSSDGQMVIVPVVVRGYTAASVANGQAGFNTIGCNKSGCHDANGPNITPSGIGKFDDLPLDYWITMGQSLNGGMTVQFHMWNASTGLDLQGQMGIVAFLRSQAPKGPPTPQ